MAIQETLLITETWDHESQNVGLALRLGDEPAYGLPTSKLEGAFVDNGADNHQVSLEQFKGETEVYYTEDGQRHVFIAGRPLGSGIGCSRAAAANAVVVELPKSTRSLPAVFSTDKGRPYRIHRIGIEKKIQSLDESPFFAAHARERIRVMGDAKELVPQEIAERISSPSPLPTEPVPSEFWIPFNRLKRNQEWIESAGAICLTDDGVSTVVAEASVVLDKGTCLGAVCSPSMDLVIIAEVS